MAKSGDSRAAKRRHPAFRFRSMRATACGEKVCMERPAQCDDPADGWVKRTPHKVLPVSFGAKPRPVGIITLKSRTLGPAVQVFIEEARTLAKRMTKAG